MASATATTTSKKMYIDGQWCAAQDGKTVGILENGKLNAVNMLRETAAVFEARHGCKIQPIYSKANASAPAPADIIASAAGDVDFLITGLGD